MAEPKITFTPVDDPPRLWTCDQCGAVVTLRPHEDGLAKHATWHGLMRLAMRDEIRRTLAAERVHRG